MTYSLVSMGRAKAEVIVQTAKTVQTRHLRFGYRPVGTNRETGKVIYDFESQRGWYDRSGQLYQL